MAESGTRPEAEPATDTVIGWVGVTMPREVLTDGRFSDGQNVGSGVSEQRVSTILCGETGT